jgi:hypothetical protein
MKKIFKYLGMFIGLIIVLFITGIILLVVNFPTCGPNSDAVSDVKSLSQQRLYRLYEDLQKLAKKSDILRDEHASNNKRRPIPDEFSDLDFAKIRPIQGNIMVTGCLDEFVYLRFSGGIWSDGDKKITLSYPNHKGPYETTKEELWSE